MLVRCLCLKCLASQNCAPVSLYVISLAVLLHVDNTDLSVLNFSNKPIFEFITEAQNLLSSWDFALKALGSDLKLEKCVWTL